MKARSYFSSFLRTEDVKKEQEVTISAVERQEFPDSKPKLALYFEEFEQGLVLNSGNGNELISWFSEETDCWIGQKVILYVDPNVLFKGKRVGGIRLKRAG